MKHIKEMADALVETVRKYVAEALVSVNERIDEVQKSIPAPVTVDVEAIAKEAAALIPAPKDGEPGKDAEPIDFGDLNVKIDDKVKAAVDALPVPKDGEPGKDAEPIDREALVKDILAQIPTPQDGKSITIEDVRPILEKTVNDWAVSFERHAQGVLQKAIDNMPKPSNGIDGLGFDDLSVDFDGERGITLKFQQGERTKEFPFTLPIVIDRGVFREGDTYEKGDGVTWGGSFFIAQKEAPEGKPGESDGWRLSVKRGRDGKNYEPRPALTESVKLT